ncbi:MAG: VanZ family protein [Thermoactinospora sp.]|nr:VanZ family protein [Thermoactinospora sp.]
MTRAWDLWGNVIIAALLGLPVALLAALTLTRLRKRAGHPAPLRTALADVGIVAGTAPWVWMILTPLHRGVRVTLVPFHELGWFFTQPFGTVFVQVVGNLLVFAALGALLPVRSRRFASLPRVALVAALASTTVEVLQYGFRLGRHSTVDDVLINTAGAVLFALVTRRWWADRIAARIVPR